MRRCFCVFAGRIDQIDAVLGLPCLSAAVHFIVRAVAARYGVEIGNFEAHSLASSLIDMTGADFAVADMALLAVEDAGAPSNPLQMRRVALSLMLFAGIFLSRGKGRSG